MNQDSPWRSILSSSTFYNSVFFAFSSLAVAFANLLLARYSADPRVCAGPLRDHLIELGREVAPAGIDGVVNRKSVVSGPWLLTRTLVTSAAVGLGMVIFAALIYDLSAAIVLWLLTGTIAGGATTVAAAKFQNAQRFMWSLSIAHICNAFLLLASLTVAFLRHQSPQLPIGLMVVGYGWRQAWAGGGLFKQSAFADNSCAPFFLGRGFAVCGNQCISVAPIAVGKAPHPETSSARRLGRIRNFSRGGHRTISSSPIGRWVHAFSEALHDNVSKRAAPARHPRADELHSYSFCL